MRKLSDPPECRRVSGYVGRHSPSRLCGATIRKRGIFLTNGRTDPVKLRQLWGQGYTVRFGNLQRWLPAFHRISQDIQRETGYSNYAHAFLTPGGEQGLLHHWDQQMAVIVQVAGTKTWQLWKPVIDSPMREWGESFRVWREECIPQWETAGPDLTIQLTAGQTLLLPRGWVHNPRCLVASPSFTYQVVVLDEVAVRQARVALCSRSSLTLTTRL
ncbi:MULTISPECIES: JmjC domain-containing protein [unclassified Streptomyces]|uniref:JmjC domain-containing protein n=1 Tax=unclassified Streptomyces TaxID=2593676 RepID=UPI00404388CC